MDEKEFQDKEFTAGETKLITFKFVNEDDNTLIDVSPFQSNLKVCYLEDKSYILLEKSGIIVPNEIGKVEFILDADNTEGWEEGSYIFQVELTSSSDRVIKGEGEWFIGGGM